MLLDLIQRLVRLPVAVSYTHLDVYKRQVLYGPGEYQQYTYLLEDRPEVFWVHFTGYEAAGLLSSTGLSLDCLLYTSS